MTEASIGKDSIKKRTEGATAVGEIRELVEYKMQRDIVQKMVLQEFIE